jgi:hypothetical protein
MSRRTGSAACTKVCARLMSLLFAGCAQHAWLTLFIDECVELARLTAARLASLFHCRRAMRLDMYTLDHWHTVDAAVAPKRLKDLKPQALPAPRAEAAIDRRLRLIRRRTIAPTRTRARHVNMPLMILRSSIRCAPRRHRGSNSSIRIVQPGNTRHLKLPVDWNLESHLHLSGIAN